MSRRSCVFAAFFWIASAGWTAPQAAGPQTSSSPRPATSPDYQAVINQYCVTCHNDKVRTANLALDTLDLSNVPAAAETWEKVIRKVRVGMMPPDGRPRPDRTTSHALVSWLESALDRAATANPNPGRPLVHRLNRAEYANAIRDLLALEVDAGVAAASGRFGIWLRQHRRRPGRVARLARALFDGGWKDQFARGWRSGDVGRRARRSSFGRTRRRIGTSTGCRLEPLAAWLARTTLPLDGEYLITVRLFRTNLGAMRGLENPHQLEMSVDGQRVHLAAFGGEADFKASLENPTAAGDDVDGRFTVRVPLKAGRRTIGVAFLQKTAPTPWRLQPFLRSSNDTLDPTGWPHIDRFTITGPFNANWPGRYAEPSANLCVPPDEPC